MITPYAYICVYRSEIDMHITFNTHDATPMSPEGPKGAPQRNSCKQKAYYSKSKQNAMTLTMKLNNNIEGPSLGRRRSSIGVPTIGAKSVEGRPVMDGVCLQNYMFVVLLIMWINVTLKQSPPSDGLLVHTLYPRRQLCLMGTFKQSPNRSHTCSSGQS